ncbi:hypothetical protein RBSH_01465 [Rhodopirellula baltica SH28]|uniref:Outer membrane efflux protein n=1 Tax=Rhodopirellula baltica SH28 TaxID=993517 RepID=K5CGL6_RHOBT|nr:hypothetical protein [Rhodopirellula baltica]EKK03155.1 hypothetical protein RBSH_01465 [Rhodopirellula baltica SH28]
MRKISSIWLLTASVLLPAAMGCNRTHYRKQADNEAYALMDEKASHVSRPVNAPLRIELDRRSRMFNPFDLDFQPMPLDDPASSRYMQCVDGRRGYPMWEANGLTNTAESPDWWQFLPLNEDGILELNSENAVKIALLHSPDYQRQMEQLYLSALDVSSQRFQFDTQYFAGAGASFNQNDQRFGAFRDSDSVTSVGGDVALRRQFATGANLLVNFANEVVWNLSGPDTRTTSTVLDFTLLQPLLRGAGRDRIMELLTLSERRLLANVRNFERFRRGFYLDIVTGRNNDSSVSRSGGTFSANTGAFTGFDSGFANLGGGGGGGVPQAGGFIGLLQDQLQIRNLEENIARLGENLVILDNTLIELLTTIPDDPEAIIRQRLQIAQARSALLNSQSSLVSRRVGYQNSVDSFLRDLGLPPYICVEINDPMLERFELIDRTLRNRREQLIEVRLAVGQINIGLLESSESSLNQETGLPETKLAWNDQTIRLIEQLRASVKPLSQFTEELINEDLPRVEEDLKRLAELIPERKNQTDSLLELYREEQATVCSLLGIETVDESIFDLDPVLELGEELDSQFREISSRLDAYKVAVKQLNDRIDVFLATGPQSDNGAEIASQVRGEVILASQDLLANLGEDVLALQLIQARARVESLLLPEVEINPAEALQIARVNRRDWANARAALVDTYRRIEFFADDLESDLDLVVSGGVSRAAVTDLPNNDNTSLRIGLRWDAPITRLQERNTYRQALIEYEQAKRSYYNFEDSVWQGLRSSIRQLQANRINFELGRQSVRIAANQLELNEDIRSFRDARGLNSGPTAARDTISALGDLLDSQNSLLNIFVNFEVVRRGLDLDLGTMELTPDGLWIDPGPIEPEYLLGLVGTSEGGLIDCGVTTSNALCPTPDCGMPLKEQPKAPIFGF